MKFRQVTEENSLYDNLEQQPVRDLLRDINREDHRVADAVEACLPQDGLSPGSSKADGCSTSVRVPADGWGYWTRRKSLRLSECRKIPSSASLPEETRRSGRR